MSRTIEKKSFAYERAFSEIKRLSHAGLGGTALLQAVAERLRRVVPFGSYCVTTLDPASNLMTRVVNGGVAGEEGHVEAHGERLARLYFEEDLDRLHAMVRGRRAAQPLSGAVGGRLERSLRYREYLKPSGFGHELAGVFSDGGAWGAGYLTREEGEPDFGRAEVSFLGRVAPHVGAGLKAAALRHRAVEDGGVGVPGVLTLDRAGTVTSHTPAAEHLLSELEPLGPAWRREGLPVPVRMAAGALKRSLDPPSGRDLELVPKVRLRGRSGRWLTLHASLTEPTPARPSEIVVVIAPTGAEEVARLGVASYDLTRREEEIVDLVARGRSTRGISGALFISEHTVQNHLRSVFEKVGVRSRRELVRRLFTEGLLPGAPRGTAGETAPPARPR